MNEMNREDLERAKYKPEQIEEINKFLYKMCPASHEYVVKIFIRARQLKKFSVIFPAIMTVLNTQWVNVWMNGTPDRIGDVDDVAYSANWIAFENVYKELDMSCPKTL